MSRKINVLTAEEARSLMQKNLKPINSQHRKSNSNISLSNMLNVSRRGSIIAAILMMIFMSSYYTKESVVVESPNYTIMSEMKRMEEPVSRSFFNTDHERGRPKIPTPLTDIKMPEVKPLTPTEIINKSIGNSTIIINNQSLTRYALPDAYYDNIDYSSFQPFMCYTLVTNKNSQAWKILNDKNAYTDENGFRRHRVNENQVSVDGEDDYVIALGTYYKEKGTAGSRFLIVTSTGKYTAITGDEKSDAHTDRMGMFSRHGGKAGLIEWIVEQDELPSSILRSGTVTTGPVKELRGKILYIYKID
jgi:hypothetical protein